MYCLHNAQYIVLYCIVLYCIVLYCIVLYCIVLYCIVLYCIVLYCIVLYCRHGLCGRTILHFLLVPADKCPDVNITSGSFEGEFIPGKGLTFSCNPGYTLVGMEMLNCRQDSTWNGDIPECLSEWQLI